MNEDDRASIQEFERRQLRELEEFQARQRQELEEFQRKEVEELKEFEEALFEHQVTIRIDRAEYPVRERRLTGAQLRSLPKPPIGPDRDLFEVSLGGSDTKIGNEDVVKIHDGLRFFTAPAQINPGSC